MEFEMPGRLLVLPYDLETELGPTFYINND